MGVRVEGLQPRTQVHRQLVLGSGSTAGPTPIARSTARRAASGSAAVRPASLLDQR
ncbi:MAG: hypothetical protein R2734_10130 [Nocardioides sp.]